MKINNTRYFALLVFVLVACNKGPDFDALVPYQEKENSYWGYIDLNGNKKIDPKFKNLPGLFYNGYALLEKPDGSFNYIDRKGQEYERNYIDACDFHEGVAFAVNEGEYPVLLNAKLEEVKILEKVDEVRLPCEGFICFKNTRGKWGYMNKDGVIVIRPVYDFAGDFSDGLALIGKTEFDTTSENMKEKSFFGYIDTKGDQVIKPTSKYETISSFSEGLAAYSDGADWGWGYVDKTGKKVIRAKLEWDEVTPFKDGIASVKIGDLWGIIDKKGKLVVNPKFEIPPAFENGLSLGKKDDKYGFINKRGEWVIEPAFGQVILGFAGRRAFVEKDNYFILIDKKGNQKKNREFYQVGFSHFFENSVKSDFFDTEAVIDTFIQRMNAGEINGITPKTSLAEVMKKYRLTDKDLPENSYQTTLEVSKIKMNDEISGTVTIGFNDNISTEIVSRIDEYWYSYNIVTGYKPNNKAVTESVSFSIDLEGRKEAKAEKLAKDLKSVIELNGFKQDKEKKSTDSWDFYTTDDGPKASIHYSPGSVNLSVMF
jgi:hypothetical protein